MPRSLPKTTAAKHPPVTTFARVTGGASTPDGHGQSGAPKRIVNRDPSRDRKDLRDEKGPPAQKDRWILRESIYKACARL